MTGVFEGIFPGLSAIRAMGQAGSVDEAAFMQQKRVLGSFTLAMITVAAIVSLRNLPLSAEFGLTSIFYFAVSALISSRLAGRRSRLYLGRRGFW